MDPTAGQVQQFAFELRKLREEAGGITYRAMAKRAGYAVTTLSQAAAGEQLPTLPVVLAYVRACGGEEAQWQARWQQAVEETAGAGPDDGERVESPYRGLARFETGDSGLFFGREQLTDDLLDLLRRRRFAAMFGPSGSGKSSLLRAGLIPALQHCQEPGLRPAAIRILTPGGHLARAHAPLLTPSTAGSSGADTFVIVDQFEEVFTLCHDGDERARFIDLLLTARQPESRLRVLLAVRGDFYGHCAEHRHLADALRDANLLAGAMNPAELRDAVVKPATATGMTVERALTARLVKEVADAPGGLPLLSHVLLETWRRRRGKTLTVAGYEAAGALEGAIAKTAEEVYDRFTESQAATARRVLLRLIAPGDGTADTRRPAERAELETASRQETARVLEALTRARLLALDGDTVELAHEALIAAWPRLRGWIETDRERLRAHRKLTEAAHAWQELGREPGALYRGSRLAAAQEHFGAAHRDDLTDLEHAFLTASVAAREQEERTATRITQRLRTLTVTLSVLLVLAVTASLVAWHQNWIGNQQRQVALSRQLAAQSAALSGTNPDLAALLATHAYRISPTSQAVESLYASATLPLRKALRHSTPVVTVAFSPDGHLLATGNRDGRVWLWDAGTGRLRKSLLAHDGLVDTVAFSRDGRTLATGSHDNTVRLWDTETGHLRMILRQQPQAAGGGQTVPVLSVAFSRDDRTVATGGDDGTVRLWDTETGHLRMILRQQPQAAGGGQTVPVLSLTISPNGRSLATGGEDGTLSLWDTDTGRVRAVLDDGTSPVDAVAFSPDGRTLATSSRARTVQLWDTDTGRLRRSLAGHAGPFASVAFSPDGRTLATGDRTVQLWDTDTGRLRRSLAGHAGPVNAVAFSPDGRTLATGGEDGTVRLSDAAISPRAIHSARIRDTESMAVSQDGRMLATGSSDRGVELWDAYTGRLRISLPGYTVAVDSLAFSQDGRTLATGSFDRGVELWNTNTGRLQVSLLGYTGDATSLAFSQDGRTLATGSFDRGVELWNTSTGRLQVSLPVAATSEVRMLAFSRDGRTLAVAGGDHPVGLWDADTGRLRRSLAGHPGAAGSLAFSPDGHILAVGGDDSTVGLWDVSTGRLRRSLAGHPGAAGSLAFSPDGHILAVASTDADTVRLWDTDTGGTVASFSGHTDTVHSVAFSQDGHTLTTGSADQTVRLWNAALPDPAVAISKICRAIGRDLTPLERTVYLPDQPPHTTCPTK
ncbi:helix-turn-helix domain-containing protein [Streptomyces xiangluensis]|uniref:Helix-turn-helix domain-containing protein n=1 Tax=Streptomyces xiangluensis TaxID=2665720 RepID=A0ABV8YL69_9ACTN